MFSFGLVTTLGLGLGCGCHAALPSDCTAELKKAGAIEIVYMENCTVYISDRRADVTDAIFNSWTPNNGWSKNPSGVRYPTFTKSCLFGSPGFEGNQEISIEAGEIWPDGPTNWILLAQMCPGLAVLGGCFPDKCASDLNAVDGSLKYYEISKCHKMIWMAGQAVNIMMDSDGNKYLMISTKDPDNSVAGIPGGNAKLPEGWTRETQTLEVDFTLTPDPPDSDSNPPRSDEQAPFGSWACGYALVQDSQGNTYHRIITTTGNSKILPELHLLMRGLTPQQYQHRMMFFALVVLVCVCGLGLVGFFFCCYKGGNAKEDDAAGMQLSADAGS